MKLNQQTLKIFTLLLFVFTSTLTKGQSEDSSTVDPEAKAILDRISSKMDAYESMKVLFEMEMKIPGQEDDVQDGYLLQKGDMFVFDIKSQSITSNREAVYVYLKAENEIQINDPDFGDDGSLLSPAQMMRLYETEQFFYAITETEKNLVKIEFKPEDEYSDYSKLRLTVDIDSDQISLMEIFSKDGSRINLSIKELLANPEISQEEFDFNVGKYPTAYIEDLRID